MTQYQYPSNLRIDVGVVMYSAIVTLSETHQTVLTVPTEVQLGKPNQQLAKQQRARRTIVHPKDVTHVTALAIAADVRKGKIMPLTDFRDKLEQIVGRLPPQSIERERELLLKLINLGGNSAEGVRTIAVTEDVDESTRAFACWILGRLDGTENAATLINLLDSGLPTIRITAVQSLANFDNPEVVAALSRLLNDPDTEIRKVSAQSLGWMTDEVAVDNLVERLQDADEEDIVRGVVAEALATSNNQKVVVPLIQALSDSSAEVRFWATFALGQLCDARAIPALQKLISDTHSIPGYGSVGKEAEDAITKIQACSNK